MATLDKIRKDIEAGIKQGIDVFKSKATLVIEKAEELTEEGKKQYRIFELKSKKQKQLASLGEKLHKMVGEKKIKTVHADLKPLLAAVDKTSAEIAVLEGKPKTVKPAPKKRPAPKKKSAKATAAVKTARPAKKKASTKIEEAAPAQ